MPIVNSHIVPQVACPGDNPLLALLEEKPGAGILNRVSCVIGHNEWARMIRLEASWLCKPVVVGSSPTGSTKKQIWAAMFLGGDLPSQGRCDGFDPHVVHEITYGLQRQSGSV